MTRASLAFLGLALCSCVHERTKAYPTYAMTPPRDAGRSAPERPSRTRPTATAQTRPTVAAAPSLAPAPAPVSPERPASPRDTFLSARTDIAAGKATVHVPAALASEATLTGGSLEDDGSGRRVATGAAVLRLRNLTVRAERVTLVLRPAGEDDFQLSARQGVSFRSDQPKSVLSETDLKSLLVTNDSYVPLR